MRPPKIELNARDDIRFRLPDRAVALWDKTLKGPTEGVTIQILAPIYPGDEESFSADDMIAALDGAAKRPITLNINSPGGSYFEGVTIFNLLQDYPNRITVNVLGEAASAASVIAMAGDHIRMYPGALMMIHSASGLAIGNKKDMRDLAAVLEKIDSVVADLYATRTGNSRAKVLEMMEAETWMTSEDALKNGFANEIVKDASKKQSPAKATQSSAVTIPQTIYIDSKSDMAAVRQAMQESSRQAARATAHAASGTSRPALVTLSATTPGASGNEIDLATLDSRSRSFNLKGAVMQTNTERVQALENTRAATVARMEALETAAAGEGRTFNEQELEEFNRLDSDVRAADQQLVAARRMSELALSRAQVVTTVTGTDGDAAGKARQPGGGILFVKQNIEKGIPFARYAMAMYRSQGNAAAALAIVQQNKRWMETSPQVAQFLMAAVGAGTTTGSGWADDLVYAQNLSGDFVDLLKAATIVDRLGLRPAPFNVRVGTKTSGTTGYWVGQGRPIPMSKLGTDVITLGRKKIAGLSAITEELALDSSPSAEQLVRDDLRDAIVKVMDESFIDPDAAEVSGISPASVTNGVTPIQPSGVTAAALRSDVARLFGAFVTAGITNFDGGKWVMTATAAIAISGMTNALGQPEFSTMSLAGGTFMGFPVIVSQTALTTSSPTGGNLMIFVLPREIMLADSGTVDVVVSREASLEMSDAPANAAHDGTGAQLVSMFQNDSLALRGIRFLDWRKRRAGVVQYINDFEYAA